MPPYVAATQSAFRFCPVCDRVVWPGTHWDDMVRVLRQAGVTELEPPDPAEREGWSGVSRREERAE